MALNLNQTSEFFTEEKSDNQIIEKIRNLEAEISKIKSEIPSLLYFGIFVVSVEQFRQKVLKKRTKMHSALLTTLLSRMREKSMEVVSEYRDIISKLKDPPSSIEEIDQKQAWMQTLPQILKNNDSKGRTALLSYDLLTPFNLQLSEQDAAIKWGAITMPTIIESQVISNLYFLLLYNINHRYIIILFKNFTMKILTDPLLHNMKNFHG